MVTAGHPFGLCTLSSSSLHLKKLLRQLGFSLPKQDQLKKDLELEGPREGCQGQQWSLSVPRLQLLPDPLSSIRVPAAPAFPGSTAVPGTQRPHSKYTLTGDGHCGEGKGSGVPCFPPTTARGGGGEVSAGCLQGSQPHSCHPCLPRLQPVTAASLLSSIFRC